MSLRELAAADNRRILENQADGFGWPVSVTDPDGLTVPDLKGFSTDISQLIDPDTGQAISGRLATVSIHIASLTEAGFTALPRGVAELGSKPWRVTFDDINGNAHTFKVCQSNPDRTLGYLSLLLEAWKA